MDWKKSWGNTSGASNSRYAEEKETQKPAAANTCGRASFGHEYEVFLSFMGDDTRKGFTDHLYTWMVDAGISVFKDNIDLPIGKGIAHSLSEAINKSKMAIPILSVNYAASRWCLDELVCMLECRNIRNQIVLPIFFGVEPSQVRHQRGSYGRALEEHAKKYDKETVEKWRKALEQVAALKGLELGKETAGHEGQLTKKVVGKVLIELKKSHLRVTEELVGVNDQENAVMDLLEMSSENARRAVGLWGMGGIGKTTLAKHIYNQICDTFESCSFLSDIREKSKPSEHNGLELLQSQLVSDLSKHKCRAFRNTDDGVSELEHTFREKKVLILLDDVDHMNQLKALAAKLDWFGPGSRIIVTTRNRDILDRLLPGDANVPQESWWACYEVKEMNQEKALQLFCRHAFRQGTPRDELSALTHAIVETTGGLPLALEVLGSFLSRKKKSIWEETLKALKQRPKEEVHERLKISYDRLEDHEKQMFLDVACLFIGEDVDVVLHVWKDRYFSAENGKDVLLMMSLIKIGEDNRIRMHDQLRDLGREIVRKENERDPRRRSRLWRVDQARHALEKQTQGWCETEAFHLRYDFNQDNYITTVQLSNFPNIWFLKLYYAELDGNFQDLLTELRWLRWRILFPKFHPTNLNLQKLLVLDLSFSRVGNDWKLWSSIQSAEELKVLNLTSCMGLVRDPDISMLKNLERLILDNCFWLKEISSIWELKNLLVLSMRNCQSITELPSSIGELKSLLELDLSGTKRLHHLPDSIGLLTNLQRLTLAGSGMKILPNSIGKLKSLRDFDLSGYKFNVLPDSICDLENLQVLKIDKGDITVLPHDIGSLLNLQCMILASCHLVTLPDSIGKLNSLCELDLSGTDISSLPISIFDLENLQVLKIANSCISTFSHATLKFGKHQISDQFACKCLKGNVSKEQLCIGISLYQKIYKCLNGLESLHVLKFSGYTLYDVQTMQQALGGVRGVEALQDLHVIGCGSIDNLPMPSNLKFLVRLDLVSCDNLQQVEGLQELEALQELNISYCPGIRKLPSLSKLKSLRILKCFTCVNIQELEGLDGLVGLEELDIDSCKTIEKLPNLNKLKSLRILRCSFCEELQELEGLDGLEGLQELHLQECIRIKKLPSFSNLKFLKLLICYGCKNLQELEGFDGLKALERFDLGSCRAIEKLPSFSKMKCLTRLNCDGCSMLQEIEGLDTLEAFKYLTIFGCRSIRHLPKLPQHLKSDLQWTDLLSCEKYIEIHRDPELRRFCSICQVCAEDLSGMSPCD